MTNYEVDSSSQTTAGTTDVSGKVKEESAFLLLMIVGTSEYFDLPFMGTFSSVLLSFPCLIQK